MDYPLFFWGDSSYPKLDLGNLGKDDLRVLRNLIYARHGYRFNSPDLNELYGGFSWYVPNPSFTEEDFSPDEKRLLERIVSRESRL